MLVQPIPESWQHTDLCLLQRGYYTRLLSLIQAAQKEIRVAQYVFTTSNPTRVRPPDKLYNALIQRHKAGVNVQILFDYPRPRSPNFRTNIRTLNRFKTSGLAPRILSSTHTLHIKIIIIDNTHLLFGSHNLTNSALYSPFELSVELTDSVIINSCIIYFNSLFNGAQIFPPKPPN